MASFEPIERLTSDCGLWGQPPFYIGPNRFLQIVRELVKTGGLRRWRSVDARRELVPNGATMRKIIATATLLFGALAAPVQADDPNAILSKDDPAQMFAMSEVQWAANAVTLKMLKLGDYRVTLTGEYTLYMRPNSVTGLLAVTPLYRRGNKRSPWKLSVTVTADTPASSLAYRNMDEEAVEKLLQIAMREMKPTYSVMGYMVRNKSDPPSVHFSIFKKDSFPSIDMLNEIGRVCPTQGGKKTCVRQHMIGSN